MKFGKTGYQLIFVAAVYNRCVVICSRRNEMK